MQSNLITVHGASEVSQWTNIAVLATVHSFHLSSEAMSIGLRFHCLSGCARRYLKRLRWSARLTENQYLKRCTTERTSSSLQTPAISRAMAVLCAANGRRLSLWYVTPEKLMRKLTGARSFLIPKGHKEAASWPLRRTTYGVGLGVLTGAESVTRR